MAFEVATFTDVTAAESVNSSDGFQFQAVSAGFDRQDQAVVQGELNFVPAPMWAAAHGGDPLSHPLQCTYAVREGRMYLTQSRALGLTANGRPGNQLTEAAVTDDVDDFVPYSPAQLMAASEWTLEKAASKVRDAWVTPLQIAPSLDAEAIERFAREDPWTLTALAGFVTMLQRSLAEEGSRVFIEHEDLTTVLRWIALGSMFLGGEAVARLTFRVFHASPWAGSFKVVGVHPELVQLLRPADWRQSPSAYWIAPASHEIGPIDASLLAREAVRWFIEGGALRAAEGIDITQWLAVLGDAGAARAADLLIDGGTGAAERDWRTAVHVVAALAAAGRGDLIEMYEDDLLDAVAQYRPRNAEEFALAAKAITGGLAVGLAGVAAGVAGPTLEALAGATEFAGAFAAPLAQPREPLVWPDIDARDAASRAWATVLAGAPESELTALFGATDRLGLDIEEALLRPAAERISAQWAANPSLGAASTRWYGRALIERLTAEKVGQQLAAGAPAQLDALMQGMWSPLGAVPESPLDGWFRAREIATMQPTARVEALRTAHARSVPRESWRILSRDTAQPVDTVLWGAIVQAVGLDDAGAAALVGMIRDDLVATPTAEGPRVPALWGPVFDALIVARTSGPELPHAVRELTERLIEARSAWVHVVSDLDVVPNNALRNADAQVRVWALDDLAAVGGMLVCAADRAAAVNAARALGGLSRPTMDAFLRVETSADDALAAAEKACSAFAVASGEFRTQLGGAMRAHFDAHRNHVRALKKQPHTAEIVDLVFAEFSPESTPSWRDPSSWFQRGHR